MKDGSRLFPLPLGEGKGEGPCAVAGRKVALGVEFLRFVRGLRREQTDAEALLWSVLRDRRLLGLKFRRQQPILGYIVDFYCHEKKLCIELDGGQHYTAEGTEKDRTRAVLLGKQGYGLLRFSNLDVLQNLEGVFLRIAEAAEIPHPSPLPGGEGVFHGELSTPETGGGRSERP
ncbi:MAG: endonuclease domain-containing protein [Nitrospirae bacterium]|nr:endonuclease domain-containing protein [Nitrospirota bacterium]